MAIASLYLSNASLGLAVRAAKHAPGARRADPPPARAERSLRSLTSAGMPRKRLLVVANEGIARKTLRDAVDERSTGGAGADVVVVAPALVGRLRYWASDDRESRKAAVERLDCCLDSLRDFGVLSHGHVGDADPLQAIDDALRLFGADEILIATPEGRSNWLTGDVVGRARARFAPPVHPIAAEPKA